MTEAGLERCVSPNDIQGELQAQIAGLLAAAGVKPELVENRPLKRRHVYRQVWRAGEAQHAFVLKRFAPERSCIERRAIERWLPALGMSDVAPALFAVVASMDGRSVWHVYEDLGDWTLDSDDRSEHVPRDRGFLAAMVTPPDWPRLEAVLARLARLHDASASHAVLGECRHWTGDLGAHYFRSCVRDAAAALAALTGLRPSQLRTRGQLLATLAGLEDEATDRCAELKAFGGPDCLLHGDFGVRNAMVAPVSGGGWHARFIDWDHAGVGPASYDLSTLLLQIPQAQRTRALETYCCYRRRPENGWPTIETWNSLFDTAERSRFANMATWPALWAADGERDSAFECLADIASWYGTLEPVLPMQTHEPTLQAGHG